MACPLHTSCPTRRGKCEWEALVLADIRSREPIDYHEP